MKFLSVRGQCSDRMSDSTCSVSRPILGESVQALFPDAG